MLLNKIESLRKEPKAVRDRYAFGVALSITLVIALVWGISLPARMKIEPTVVRTDDTRGPTITDQISDIRELVNSGIEDIKTQAATVNTEGEETTLEANQQVETESQQDQADIFSDAPASSSATTTSLGNDSSI